MSPITSVVNQQAIDDVVSLGSKLPDSRTIYVLQHNSPIFFNFAKYMCEEDCQLVLPICLRILEVFNKLQNHKPHDTGSAAEQHLCCLPMLPQLCGRGSYVADSLQPSKHSLSCSKVFHSSLTPGLFTLHCQHG